MGTGRLIPGTLFITRTLARQVGDKRYETHRLIWSEPVKGKMCRYAINLGVHYPFPTDQWPALCAILRRLMDERDQQQQLRFEFDPTEEALLEFDPPELVREAHHLFRRMMAKMGLQSFTESEDAVG